MRTITNDIVIKRPPDLVYRSCVDVERWPEIFSSCKAVEKTPVGKNEVLMDLTVANELGENTIRSRRRYQPETRQIAFEMLTVPPAFAAMTGSWSVEGQNDGARLVVVHEYRAKDADEASAGELGGKIFQATERVLGDLKAWLEAEAAGASAAQLAARPDLADAYGAKSLANAVDPGTFESCELFFARLILGGADWGDITNALKGVKKENTFEDWTDWHDRWVTLGGRYQARAEAAQRAGFDETRRQTLLKAAACNHFAEFMYFDAPEAKMQTRRRVTDLFERAIPVLNERVVKLSIPHAGEQLPAYLLSRGGEEPGPCVIIINGLDSAKEVELYAFAREFVARGMRVLLFDGPGQGLLSGSVPMVIDFEKVMGSVLEVLGQRPEVDSRRLGVFGVSFGGYLAARAAACHPGVIKACVNLSGGFDHDHYRGVNVMVRKDFRFVFGVDSEEEMERLCRQHLNLRDVPPLRAPLLTIHGELDSIIPFESCQRLMDWAVGEKRLVSYPGERHVCTNYFSDYIPLFSDWMAERLGCLGDHTWATD